MNWRSENVSVDVCLCQSLKFIFSSPKNRLLFGRFFFLFVWPFAGRVGSRWDVRITNTIIVTSLLAVKKFFRG